MTSDDDYSDDFPCQSREVGILHSKYANELPNAEVVHFYGRRVGELGRNITNLDTEHYEIFENPDGNYHIYLHRIKDARQFTGEFIEINGDAEIELQDLQSEFPELARAIGLPKLRNLKEPTP